jgi:hypothetical protein
MGKVRDNWKFMELAKGRSQWSDIVVAVVKHRTLFIRTYDTTHSECTDLNIQINGT